MFSANKILMCAVIAFTSSSAVADGGYWGGGYGGVYGYGYAGLVGPQAYIPAPPYFAMHPPVYYGARYTRPYGMSPFASAPMLQPNPGYTGQRAPRLVPPPMILANPHCQIGGTADINAVAESTDKKTAETMVAPAPLVIDNPFVVPSLQYTNRQID